MLSDKYAEYVLNLFNTNAITMIYAILDKSVNYLRHVHKVLFLSFFGVS